jgi:hypothetical protein
MASHDKYNEGMGASGKYHTLNHGGSNKIVKKKKKTKKNKDKKGGDKEEKPNVVIEEESSDDDVSENEFQASTWQEMLHDNEALKEQLFT